MSFFDIDILWKLTVSLWMLTVYLWMLAVSLWRMTVSVYVDVDICFE